MAAANTDQLTAATLNSRPTPTQVTATRVGGGTTLTCNSLTGWPTATAVHFITYKVDTSGNKVAGTQLDLKGIVSGTTITQILVKAGSDTGNAIGDIVEASPTAAWATDLYNWGIAQHKQDGSHTGITTDTVTATGTITAANFIQSGGAGSAGWTVGLANPTTVTANGNRSYTCVFNGTDLTGILSAGMRLRTQRTVAAPTQCTSLNGTTQFYSKTSPAGMTFTNNFVVSAWVKLTSYATCLVASRYNGTSGWGFAVLSTGQVQLQGANGGAGNTLTNVSYQSLPLNKWVHISAQMDMTVTTNTPTTNYITIDGVDVPLLATRAGTNPTALVQAGNLEIGSQNGGLLPFPGKIAQVAIYSAKVTQANIAASSTQSLAGTETNLISAYSFNNSINDLNANANNLTANGSAVATNADSPFGGQADGTISSTLDYGIITKTAFSTNTTLTIQVPEGCTIPTSGGVSAVSYSTQAAPYQLPALSKFKLSAFDTSATLTNPLIATMVQFVIDHPIDSLQVTSSGTAAGTYYLDVQGTTRRLTGITANVATSGAGGNNYTVNFLTNFFSTIESAITNPFTLTTDSRQYTNGVGTNTSTLTFGLVNAAAASSSATVAIAVVGT